MYDGYDLADIKRREGKEGERRTTGKIFEKSYKYRKSASREPICTGNLQSCMQYPISIIHVPEKITETLVLN